MYSVFSRELRNFFHKSSQKFGLPFLVELAVKDPSIFSKNTIIVHVYCDWRNKNHVFSNSLRAILRCMTYVVSNLR